LDGERPGWLGHTRGGSSQNGSPHDGQWPLADYMGPLRPRTTHDALARGTTSSTALPPAARRDAMAIKRRGSCPTNRPQLANVIHRLELVDPVDELLGLVGAKDRRHEVSRLRAHGLGA